MSKKLTKTVTEVVEQPIGGNQLPVIFKKSVKTEEIDLPEGLPEVFKTAEIVDAAFPPMVNWQKIGQFCWGIYRSQKPGVGSYDTNVYTFDTPHNEGTFRWGMWGSAAIDHLLSDLLVGDVALFYYLGEIPTDRKPMKNFKMLKIPASRLSEDDYKKLNQAFM